MPFNGDSGVSGEREGEREVAGRVGPELRQLEAGVDVHEIYRRIYEGVPYGKVALLARGLSRIERYDDGSLTLTRLSSEDYRDTGAQENYSEGVVDHLRAIEGTAVAALVRDRGGTNEGIQKVSLRASDERVDVFLGHQRPYALELRVVARPRHRGNANRSGG